ncbi:hypothetical protein D5875_24945, partial [Salmonella enterica subsp. enterica]|nr:hypothetical protein [Salmonella enterica subsp. enterica serovar Enteritidis]
RQQGILRGIISDKKSFQTVPERLFSRMPGYTMLRYLTRLKSVADNPGVDLFYLVSVRVSRSEQSRDIV